MHEQVIKETNSFVNKTNDSKYTYYYGDISFHFVFSTLTCGLYNFFLWFAESFYRLRRSGYPYFSTLIFVVKLK